MREGRIDRDTLFISAYPNAMTGLLCEKFPCKNDGRMTLTSCAVHGHSHERETSGHGGKRRAWVIANEGHWAFSNLDVQPPFFFQLQRPPRRTVLRLNKLTFISRNVTFFRLADSRRLRNWIRLCCRDPALVR
jgi:hypothetical protein